MKRYTVEEWQAMFPDDRIRALFMAREDIVDLSVEAQEQRWEAHRANLHAFFAQLSRLETIKFTL